MRRSRCNNIIGSRGRNEIWRGSRTRRFWRWWANKDTERGRGWGSITREWLRLWGSLSRRTTKDSFFRRTTETLLSCNHSNHHYNHLESWWSRTWWLSRSIFRRMATLSMTKYIKRSPTMAKYKISFFITLPLTTMSESSFNICIYLKPLLLFIIYIIGISIVI